MICQNERRREEVRKHPQLNGLDYLEVSPDQRTLSVYFLGKAPPSLDPAQVLIEGGRRIRGIRVVDVRMYQYDNPELDDFMEVVVDRTGDFSTYTLRVVERDAHGHWRSYSAFDPRYDRLTFSFKVDCPSDLDCQQVTVCPPERRTEPDINYLAKDYSSFRQLLLDRLALVMPEWRERHVPDLGITLVELLAYVGDYLSYYQDAVATEAYLDTARQRISVRRHTRLVDYQMHEGCNARAWVCVTTDTPLTLEPDDVYFLTGPVEVVSVSGATLTEVELRQIPTGRFEVFEPVTDMPIRLYAGQHEIRFYTWGDQECCLPRGATTATFVGILVQDEQPAVPPTDYTSSQQPTDIVTKQTAAISPTPAPEIHLKPGDVLIFEEVIGPKTGNPADADPNHRHAVRLTHVEAGVDPLNGQHVMEITWADEDALPFPLCLSALGPPPACKMLEDVSVARGNIILVDHGQSVDDCVGKVPVRATLEQCVGEGIVADTVVVPGPYSPTLPKAPLTFRQPLVAETPAARTLRQEPRQALPQVILTSESTASSTLGWAPQRDLLGSQSQDRHFVAEMDDAGHAHLRFGDGELGQRPEAGMQFHARYRIGNGPSGNVGANAISRLVTRHKHLSGGITNIRNPLPAAGGTQPEPLAEVKLLAPQTFRNVLQRAITADDYAAIVQREFQDKVQRAAATLRWNGSWHEVLVMIDPFGTETADPGLLEQIATCLHRYRRMGHDVVVQAAQRVPLYIEMTVCLRSHSLRSQDVKAVLLAHLSNRMLPNGRRGFFHPDNLTFGTEIALSALVAAVHQAVSDVESVTVERLERLFEGAHGEVERGLLPLGPLEIAQVDNDPSFPEHGQIVLKLGGGR